MTTHREEQFGERGALPKIVGGSLYWWHAFNDARTAVLEAEQQWPRERGGFDPADRLAVLMEEVGEVATECIGRPIAEHYSELRSELCDVAAVALRWIAAMDDERDDEAGKAWADRNAEMDRLK